MTAKPWDELLGTWFSREDQDAVEWAVGCIIAGGPKKILVIMGDGATGKTATINLMMNTIRYCREESKLRVIVSHDGFLGIDERFFGIVANNVPLKNHSERIIEVNTTGKKLPRNVFQNLTEVAATTIPGAIGSQCLATYRRLGESYFNQENN